jgi:hypothetical protein
MAQYTQYSGYEDNQYGGYEDQQRAPPSGFGGSNAFGAAPPRPMVDPDAEGEVDLNL